MAAWRKIRSPRKLELHNMVDLCYSVIVTHGPHISSTNPCVVFRNKCILDVTTQVFQLFGTLLTIQIKKTKYSDTISSHPTNQQIDRKPNNFLLFPIFSPRTNKLSFHLSRQKLNPFIFSRLIRRR